MKDSYSVSLNIHPFYKHLKYDFGPYPRLFGIIFLPILLAYLGNLCEVFIYFYTSGFILNRKYDFIYLKWKEKKIITFFVGTDIRSIKNSKAFFKKLDMDCFCNYYKWLNPIYETEFYEQKKKEIAKLAEKYADIIFDFKFGQYSYITRKTYSFRIPVDMSEFNFNEEKFKDMSKIIIVHAPSSPIIKGTPLVRATIKKLKLEGYKFEYHELIGVNNEQVKYFLAKSHIVLNQFYALGCGLFGIEAMAAGNAVLMSADPDLNPDIPQEAKDAWGITHYWEVYDKLKMLLDNLELIKKYAYNGRKFLEKYHSLEKVREYLLDIFEKEGII